MHRRCFLAVLLAPWRCDAQTRLPSLAINPERPFVYLEFGRVGPRQPLAHGEGNVGIWLRLHNNSAYPIRVDAYQVDSASPEITLRHAVVPVGPQGSSLRPPVGYDTADVSSPVTLGSGDSLSFSVPAEHIGPDWYVRIKFEFQLSVAPRGRTPTMFTDFVWTDIPIDRQKALRSLGSAGQESRR